MNARCSVYHQVRCPGSAGGVRQHIWNTYCDGQYFRYRIDSKRQIDSFGKIEGFHRNNVYRTELQNIRLSVKVIQI